MRMKFSKEMTYIVKIKYTSRASNVNKTPIPCQFGEHICLIYYYVLDLNIS